MAKAAKQQADSLAEAAVAARTSADSEESEAEAAAMKSEAADLAQQVRGEGTVMCHSVSAVCHSVMHCVRC